MMDCTQILDDLAFDEPKEIKDDKKIQYGSLEIGGKSYPIYKGENRIGRDSEACSVVIDSKALSKEHAVIDVADYDNHHLYDLSSTNKTRMGKLVLQPYIRYNIQDQATIMFADISAMYHKYNDIGEISAVDDSKSTSTEDLEDTVNDLDTQIECHYGDEKLKPTVMSNIFADNIYDAPTQCEDLENETVQEAGRDLTSLTTSATLLSNDTNENKSVSNETESGTILKDQSFERSLLEGDEDMFAMSVSGSGEIKNGEKGKPEVSEPTCNQQEEKKKSNCQQSESSVKSTAGQSSEPCPEKSFTLDLSSGDETDPEDIFCAQTQQFPVLKKNLETKNMGDTFGKQELLLSTEKSKGSDTGVGPDKKVENTSVTLTYDTFGKEQQMKENCVQSNFTKQSAENNLSTLPLQDNENKQDLDSASKEVASGDETDPEELFCAPTQKFCASEGKSSTDKTNENDLEDLYGAPTKKFVSIDSKEKSDSLINIPQSETKCQPPKVLHTSPKQVELSVCKQSEQITELETDLSDTTLEDVICPGTQESRRMATEMEINETPERDLLVKGFSGRKSVIDDSSNGADVLRKQNNENRQESDMDVDELFFAPTQKIEDFCDLSKVNKADRIKTHNEKGECEKYPKLVAGEGNNQPPELMKEALRNNVVKVGACSDVYSQPTQKWDEEQQFQGNVDSKCNTSEIKLEIEIDLQELFSQPTQKFCGSSTNYEITKKENCFVQETDVGKLPKGASEETFQNKSGNASPSVLAIENAREGSSDVCDTVPIREIHGNDDIFSCPTQKLDGGLAEKSKIGVAVQLPTVCNNYEKDIFSADTQDFPQKTRDSRKTESERILNSLRVSESKTAHLQHSTRGGVDGPDDSLSGEDEEVIKILSKDVVSQRDSNCESEKHTNDRTKQGNKCSTAGDCLKNIVNHTTECREKDEDTLEMELHLPQSQEVIAALKELENKAILKTVSKDCSGNVENSFSSPVIPRKRKSKAQGERKLNTIQESHISENIKTLSDTPKSISNSLDCVLETNSNEKRKVTRQCNDGHTKNNPNLHAVQSTEIAPSSEEQSKHIINPLPNSKDSGSRKSVRERKKTWKLAETTDSTSPGQSKTVENVANRTSHRKTSERNLRDSLPETSTERAPGKRHSRLKKALVSVESNNVSESESDSKNCLHKNIRTETDKPSVPCDNREEMNQCGSASKTLKESKQRRTTNYDKNDSSISVDIQQSEYKIASKFKEPLEESKHTSGRTRRSRLTSVSNVSEGIQMKEDKVQNSTKSRATRLRNPKKDKGTSSDESCQELENIGLESRKSKHNSRVSTSEGSVKSTNHKQITNKLIAEKINHNENDEPFVRLSDHLKESQKNVLLIPQMSPKGDTCVITEDVEKCSSAEKRTSKRKLDKINSHRSRNTKDTNKRSASPIDKVHEELNQNISLDKLDPKETPPPNKKRKVTQCNVEMNGPLRKDILVENCSKGEEPDVKSVRTPRRKKTGSEQSKSVPDITRKKNTSNGTDSPESREFKNVPAITRKRRAISEKLTNDVSPITRQEQLICEREKTTKCDSPVKKPKTSLPFPPKGHENSLQHKDSSDSSTENSEKSPRASHRLSTRPAKTNHQVLFTGLNDPRLQTTVQNLGGKVMEKPEDCNVLVTDKVRRTYKFLCVMGQGKPIVSPDWLLKSQKSGRFLDPWEFLLNDKENETKFKFSLKTSLLQCGKAKLLTGFSVAVTPNVKPPPQEMKGIVESCGGIFIEALKKFPENSFIVSCNEDKHMWSKLKKLGPPIVGAEALLLGVLQQKLNLNTYILK